MHDSFLKIAFFFSKKVRVGAHLFKGFIQLFNGMLEILSNIIPVEKKLRHSIKSEILSQKWYHFVHYTCSKHNHI